MLTEVNHIHSFPASASNNARILILGSIPGKASLIAQQYYAHPRNQFWPIICELLELNPNAGYAERISALNTAGVALWDVVKSCQRSSSLDADIKQKTIVTNDFATFFKVHTLIENVFFNGTAAEQAFSKYVAVNIKINQQLNLVKLPSTSPAHASMSYQQKLCRWQIISNILAAAGKPQ
jgi:double-stranded uracil-DNA glycosylase